MVKSRQYSAYTSLVGKVLTSGVDYMATFSILEKLMSLYHNLSLGGYQGQITVNEIKSHVYSYYCFINIYYNYNNFIIKLEQARASR